MAFDAARAMPSAASRELAVTGLAKAYGPAAPVFSGVSFAVARGEAVAIVGANGAGKSTLLRCCLGLILPTAGRVEVLGIPLEARTRMRELRARTGLVAQKHNLVPRLSVLSNVIHGLLGGAAGPRYWSHAFAPAAARVRAMEALVGVGMAEFALQRADRLSGGQSQRVAIARALVCRPRLLIADEPTASLDPAAGEEVMALFFSLVRREGVTVVFTSHNVQHALSYGDRILGLAQGRLHLDAPARGLQAQDLRGLYA